MTTMVVAMLGNYWWKFLGDLCDDDDDENDDNNDDDGVDNYDDEGGRWWWANIDNDMRMKIFGRAAWVSLRVACWVSYCSHSYLYPDVANVDDDNTFILVVVILMMPM